MALSKYAATFLSLALTARSQQVGTSQAEVHPALPYSKCTSSGCTSQNTAVVLDANWRWVHNVGGYTNCYSGNTWNSQYCPDATTCAANCALEGASYSGTYGITANSGALTLKLKTGSNVGSRTYLINSSNQYEMFKLKNMEFTFDVDVSQLGCGLNGALYFVKMDADGGLAKYSTNKAGAQYGTGYCDAQCPQDLKFIAGKANNVGWVPSSGDPNSGTGTTGSCCTEMDIWEANSISEALTPHTCSTNAPCTSNTTCGVGSARQQGYCDKDGCDFNPYRWGNKTFYGPGSSNTLNTQGKITVVTQFITSNGLATGTLSAIKRIYVQNGKVIQQSNTNVAGISTTNTITDSFCSQQKSATGDPNTFAAKGGLAAMGQDMDSGMVLVMSIWDDYTAGMRWLDSTYPETASPSTIGAARGTCSTTSGNPKDVESQQANAQVVFSNIKFGTLNSTYKAS